MSQHEPNRDMLSAYADGVLSPDAVRSMEQHLAECEVCADALESERRFLAQLDTLADVEPPEDFVNAVMGRVAQHPIHQPGNAIPWRVAMRYGVAASVILAVLLGGGITWIIGAENLPRAEPGAVMAYGINGTMGLATDALTVARDVVNKGAIVFRQAAELLWTVTVWAAGRSWTVQLTLLFLTISLNYAFTRLVLNYQRRH